MSSHKRRRNQQQKAKPAAPLLPPDVGDDEVDISDEDLRFVAKHRQYAGFLSSLDTSSITKQVLGIKSNKKENDNLESYYEKRAKLVHKGKEDDTNLVDPADVLPVKTLSGELHYANAKSKSELEKEAKHFHIGSGTRQRVIEIESAIPYAWDEVIRGSTSMPHHQGWWGYFDENGLAILVKNQYLLFTIAEDQDTSHHTRICFDFEDDSPILTGLAWEPIRVVGSCGRGLRRSVDPHVADLDTPSQESITTAPNNHFKTDHN
ncbi:hypothetical protein L7F22_055912 [Adiantum nelumboides]|nr:hypothetical protein [Adiantum nelumboides]